MSSFTTISPARRSQMIAVALLMMPIVATVGLCALQLSEAHAFGGVYDYDDGVYFGAAIRLVNGALPYRDFVFVHPPGIALVLSPFAYLARATGTEVAFGWARIFTVFISAGNVALVGLLLRRRGLLVALIASWALALFPLSVAATNTVLLEPYFVFFVLLGFVFLYAKDVALTSQRVLCAGLLVGFACSIKLWALLPAFGLLCSLFGMRKARPLLFSAGLAIGFGLPCLPFVVLAPRSLLRDVIEAQWQRSATGSGATGLADRLDALIGAPGLSWLGLSSMVGAALALVFGAMLALGLARAWRRLDRLDAAILVSAISSTIAVLVSPAFYGYYAYLPVVFLSVLVAIAFGHVCGRWRVREPRARKDRGRARSALALLAGLLVVALFVQVATFDRQYVEHSAVIVPGAGISAFIPEGACTLFDEPALAIVADRYQSADPSCPPLVDPFGQWLVSDPSRLPPSDGPYAPALTEQWRSWISRAKFVVLRSFFSDYLPWSSSLRVVFDRDFRLLAGSPGAYVFERN